MPKQVTGKVRRGQKVTSSVAKARVRSDGGSPDRGKRGKQTAAAGGVRGAGGGVGGAGVAADPVGKKTGAVRVKALVGKVKSGTGKRVSKSDVLDNFGDTSPEPSDDDSPKLKDPPEWGMPDAQVGKEGTDEGDEDDDEVEDDDEDDDDEDDSGSVFKPTVGDDSDSYDDAMFDSETEPFEDLSYYQVKAVPGRSLMKGGPERPTTTGLSEEAAEEVKKKWRIERKRYTDQQASLARRQMNRLDDSGLGDLVVDVGQDTEHHTGVLTDTLRMMSEVDEFPLQVGHTFPSKELVLIRIAEEANFCGCPVSLVRSDDLRVHAMGRNGSGFVVTVYFSNKSGWKVCKCDTRSALNIMVQPATVDEEVIVPPLKEPIIVCIEEGTADGGSDGEDEANVLAEVVQDGLRDRSPIKSRWIVPLIVKEIAESPNMPSKHLKNILAHHIKDKFISPNLIQKARAQAKLEVFGHPEDNVQFVDGLVEEIKQRGHDVLLVKKDATEVAKILERMVVAEESNKRKAHGNLMTKQDKISYLKSWKVKNIQMLIDGGLDRVTHGAVHGHSPSSFVTGLFFSTSAARKAVPLLQKAFQGDAAHVSFGKYMIYSMYGITANGNTYLVGMGLHFGNETKEDWAQYFQFVKAVHPSLADYKTTFITDQGKGLVESIKDIFPDAGHFHCSYHRRQSILKACKGGIQKNSTVWLYNLCLKATNVTQLDHIKFLNAPNVDDKGFKYLCNLPDTAQYPAARCGMGEGICMYQRNASSAAESMNQANKPVREKSAVDIVNAVMLFLKLENKRHQEHKDMAWKWTEFLTPYGKNLRDTNFALVKNQRLYDITVIESDDRWNCRVVRTSMNERRCWFLKNPVMGSVFGGCSCGGPLTDGVPCHHMIAVVKSSRIRGLNENNAMPHWWTTEMWRLQYPMDSTVLCDFDMNTLKDKYDANTTMRYCPPYVAANKSGRPKTEKRLKSSLESAQKKRKKMTISESMKCESKNEKMRKKKPGRK